MDQIQMIAPVRRMGAFRRGIARMFDMILALFVSNFLVINFVFANVFKTQASRLDEIIAELKVYEEAKIDFSEFAVYKEYIELTNFQYIFVFVGAVVLLIALMLIVNALAKGQTIGKMLGGIKVVNQDGSQVSAWKLVLRELMSWSVVFIFLIVSSSLAAAGIEGLSLPISIASALFIGSIVISTIARRKPGELVKQTWYDKLLGLEVVVK